MIGEPGLLSNHQNSTIKCPYQWMKGFAKELIESAIIKGNLLSFYDLFGKKLQENIPFVSFGRMFAHHVQYHGKFTSIINISEPQYVVPGSDIWLVEIILKSENGDDFLSLLNISGDKKIYGFNFQLVLKYHPPNYIKKENFENETINEDPLIILSKPINFSKNANNSKENQFPCALLVHTEFESDVDFRIGYCHPGLDFEYLSSNKIGLIRAEYADYMFNHDIINGKVVKYNDPVLIYTTKMIELALSRHDISHIFIILHSFASLSLSSIVKKFQGIIQGIILINPYWSNGTDLCISPMKEEDIPKNIPILLIGGGYSTCNTLDDYKKWETAFKKIGNEYDFYDHCDSFLFESHYQPSNEEYAFVEKHISDVPLRRIAQWIRAHSDS